MASYESLTFQMADFKEELFSIYDIALDEAVNYVIHNFKPEGGSKTKDDPSDIGREVQVSANSLMAWVLEYGSGFYADIHRNPYWDDYLHSGLTSSKRAANRFVKRGKRTYQTLDLESGEIVTREGANPEGGYIPDRIQLDATRKPEPFLQDMLKQAYDIFESRAYSLSQSINPEKFFIKSVINL